ncbi:hypothetical protein LguiB_000038 [Lonicera macranthoides]
MQSFFLFSFLFHPHSFHPNELKDKTIILDLLIQNVALQPSKQPRPPPHQVTNNLKTRLCV